LSDSCAGRGRFELSAAAVKIDSASHFDVAPGRYVRLSVLDNGCGIEREVRERIFERFYTTRKSGTGLGLASVAEFMAATGGAIRVESTPNVGTAFHLYFPVRKPVKRPVPTRAQSASHSADDDASSDGLVRLNLV
jgi:signal transduction histidine kinase